MKNLWKNPFAFGLLLCFVSGCQLAGSIKKAVEKSQAPQVITGKDNLCQITVPGNWKERTDLHEDAAIQAANLMAEQYVIIIPESKADFGENFTIDSLTEIARDNFKEAAAEPVLTEPIPVNINGYPARQFETSGEIENIKAKYLYAVVETPDNYYQIITWTLNSKFEKNKSVFLDVINSFRENGAARSASPSPILKSNTKR